MTDSTNPHTPVSDSTACVASQHIVKRWPVRLTVGIRIVIAFVICQLQPVISNASEPKTAIQDSLQRAAHAPVYDDAAAILFATCDTSERMRNAALSEDFIDERNLYIVLGLHWGSQIESTRELQNDRRIDLSKAISDKPELIHDVLRAERYESYLYSHAKYGHGAATINFYPFFSRSSYADDLAEIYIESLRHAAHSPKQAIMHPHAPNRVMISEEEHELGLLEIWQRTCGLTGQLELIKDSQAQEWRTRFELLDAWFKINRPYSVWDNESCSIRADSGLRKFGKPTNRKQRFIPELAPPWDTATHR